MTMSVDMINSPGGGIPIENLRILIIDDSKEVLGILRNMLLELGVSQVFDSPDGRKGLEFVDIAADMVDFVICDWNMPHISGIELLRQIRSVYPDMPFLMVTGRADANSVMEAKAAGVDGYITKPFSKSNLRDKIVKIMKKRRGK